MDHIAGRIEMNIPTSLDMLTPQFLSEVLGTGVRSIRIIQEHIGDGLIGSLVRIGLEYDQKSVIFPETMVAKFTAFDLTARTMGNFLGAYEREVRFYNEIVGKTNLRSPHCYYAGYNPIDQASLLLLEDLSAYQNVSWPKGCSISQAKQAVKEIARLHAAWWNLPELGEIPWLYHPKVFLPNGYAAVLATRWGRFRILMQLGDSAEVRQIGEMILREVDAAGEHLENSPITLIHNDYHLNNLFFNHPNDPEEVIVLDWGSLRAAKGAADVAYFLGGCLAPADRRSAEMAIINDYLEALAQFGVQGYTQEHCFIDYKKAMIYYLTRFIIAIAGMESIEGSMDRPLDERAFAFWKPIINRYLTAVADFYLTSAA